MDTFLYFYQHLQEHISPIAFSIGPISVGWYALMYLVGFGIVYFLLKYRIKTREYPAESQNCNSKFKTCNTIPDNRYEILNTDTLFSLLFYLFIGLLIGARLGYVLFYNLPYYLENPLEIIWPFDESGNFVGLYGMSYHGGLIGAIIAGYMFSRKFKINFLPLVNFVIPAVPAGYFFGRIGNFLNGELYGRMTEKFWGMYFPADFSGSLRHPSQLYEAALEGLIPFLILWPLRNSDKFKDKLLGLYLTFYAVGRIISEFFREPDSQIGILFGFLTLGQILSLVTLIFGLFFIFYGQKSKKVL